jgi:hypothetical protein
MPPAAAAPPTALSIVKSVQGAYSDALSLSDALERARSVANVIAPPLTGGRVPDGFAAAVAVVMVDPVQDAYELPGSQKRGLSKKALDDIAGAAGITWLPYPQSRRLDDGSDPRYCLFQAVALYRDFGCQPVTVSATKEMDLREGSPTVEAIVERCVRKAEKDAREANRELPKAEAERIGREKAANQLRELRLHIVGHAESKARNRAIRTAMGLRTSYTQADLKKPFVIARLQFTGRSEDPETQRQLTLMNAAAAMGGVAALYGSSQPALPGPTRQDPAPVTPPPAATVPPPAPGASAADEDLVEQEGPEDGYDGEAGPETPPAAAAAPRARPDTSGLVLPKTKNGPGEAVARTDTGLLEWWESRFLDNVNDEQRPPNYRAKDRDFLAAVTAELKWRKETGGDKVRE